MYTPEELKARRIKRFNAIRNYLRIQVKAAEELGLDLEAESNNINDNIDEILKKIKEG